MQLVAVSKLAVDAVGRDALLATLRRVNAARTWVAAEAMALPTWERRDAFCLHRAFYGTLRERFGLGSQMAVRALAAVAACFARDPHALPRFRDTAAIGYDARNLTFLADPDGHVRGASVSTLAGRVKAPLLAGGPHAERLRGDRGASALVLRKGRWYLHTAVEVPAPAPVAAVPEPGGWLGVDLGVVNLATDSDGVRHSGAAVERVRLRIAALRAALQSAGTRSAKRHLQKLAGREARFRADVNHRISKHLVAGAQGTGRGLAVEDLRGIRDRVTVRRGQRVRLSGWAFHQLRFFLSYKAARAGVPVAAVDPRNTSRTCPACGHCDRRNRPSQAAFRCVACGFQGHADHVAATNIASRAAVNRPIVPGCDAGNAGPTPRDPAEPRRKPRAEARGR